MSPIIITIFLLLFNGCDWGDKHGKHGAWSKGSEDHSKVADWRVLVESVSAKTGTVAKELVTHGTLESETMADITPEAGGVVTAIKAEEGDTVRKGQVLAILSSPSIEATSERARLELAAAQRKFGQAEKLHRSGAISDTEFLEAKDAFAIASASFKEASGTHEFTRLTSPVDGTVAIRNVRIGELASGAEAAFQVVDLNRLRVIVNLSEGDLTHLSVGQPVSLAGTYNTRLRAKAAVLRISPIVDATTGTVRVTLAVEPMTADGPHLRPGQFVEVRISVDQHENVVTIPRSAVRWLDGSPIAWRIIEKPPQKKENKYGKDKDKPGFFDKLFADDDAEKDTDKPDPWAGVPRRIVERVNLSLGYTDADRAEVSAGLAVGEQVVTTGGDNLRPDAEVKLPGDPNPQKMADDTGNPESGEEKE